MKSAPREVLVERFGNLKLPLGGKYEYVGVRGKQGRTRDRFQGYTPKKTHFTELCDTDRRLLCLLPLSGRIFRWAVILSRSGSRAGSVASLSVRTLL